MVRHSSLQTALPTMTGIRNMVAAIQSMNSQGIAACVRTPFALKRLRSMLPGAAIASDPASLLKAMYDGSRFRALLFEQGDPEAFSAAVEMKIQSEALQLHQLRTTGMWTSDLARALRDIDTAPANLATISIVDDLLTAARYQNFHGTWTLGYGSEYGCVWFEQGRVIDAETLNSKGTDALDEIRTWRPRQIELHRSITAAKTHGEPLVISTQEVEKKMKAKETEALLSKLAELDGYIAAALVSVDSGMVVSKHIAMSGFNIDLAAAANADVVKAKIKAVSALGLKDQIEDILITLGKQYHLIRPMRTRSNYFFYLSLNKQAGNLALARFQLEDIEGRLSQLLA
ncbi:MAG: hypothetical protein AAF449_03385 [Myxococcota bacterium]